ncbi:MAG: VOC family protein [Pseudomonadota bacterium]
MDEPRTGIRSMAVLPCSNVAASVAFYRDQLGFRVDGQWPDGSDPDFAIVGFGTVTIALDGHGGGVGTRQGWVVYVYLADIDSYAAQLSANGVTIERAPEDAFYGCRDMDVRDPDGNLIAFGQDLMPGPMGPGL